MSDGTLYAYDLGKTILPGFLTKGIRIQDSWVNRCKRYLGSGQPDLNRLINFIKRGLTDKRAEGFNEKALDAQLTVAQQWLLLYLVLKDGVPEWIRDHENDEDAPEMQVEEPKPKNTVQKVAGAAGAVAGAAVKPVTSLGQMMGVIDSDGDGIPDDVDTDDDNDGIPDSEEVEGTETGE